MHVSRRHGTPWLMRAPQPSPASEGRGQGLGDALSHSRVAQHKPLLSPQGPTRLFIYS